MEGVLSLGLLALASAGLLATTKKKKEGFQQSQQSQQTRQVPGNPAWNAYVEKGGRTYNPLMNLANPLKNTMLPVDYTQQDLQEAQERAQNSLNSPVAVPNDPTYDIIKGDASDLKINDGRGAALNAIRKCESVRTSTCDAFDDPAFQNNCGICFDDGKDSLGKGTLGGLFITETEKGSAEEYAAKMKLRDPLYTPTIGSCKPGRFVTDKQQCIRLQNKLNCEKKQNFSVPGCSQCMQDSTFHYVDDRAQRTYPSVVLVGNGSATLIIGTTRETKQVTLSTTPQTVEFTQYDEGDILSLSVKGTSTAPAFVAGYLIGNTASGSFSINIVPLVLTDGITNSKPRLSGSAQIGENYYTVMRPGPGKTEMRLSIQNPFTFLSSNEEEATQCSAAPYNTKESSVRLLNNSICYKPGQTPGKYSQDCLINLYESAGCTAQGKAYPNSRGTQYDLLYKEDGNPREVGDIADYLNSIYDQATTGSKNGAPLTVMEWDAMSMKCFGKEIKSPCDQYTESGKPLGADCLDYLWMNRGSSDKIEGGLASTYTGPSKISSLENFTSQQPLTDRYCRRDGTMAPIDSQGRVNEGAVAYAQSLGSVEAVRKFYDSISRKANNNALPDEQRQESMLQCYGINIPNERQIVSNASLQTRRGLNDSILTNPTAGQRTPFQEEPRPEQCQVIRPQGEDVNLDTDRLAPRIIRAGSIYVNAPPGQGMPLIDYSKPILVVNDSSTQKMMIWSNVGTIQKGSTVRIAYIQNSSSAPSVLKVFLNTNIFNNQNKGTGPFFDIPTGTMGTFTALESMRDWDVNYDKITFRTEPYDINTSCLGIPASGFVPIATPNLWVFKDTTTLSSADNHVIEYKGRWDPDVNQWAYLAKPFTKSFTFSFSFVANVNFSIGLQSSPPTVEQGTGWGGGTRQFQYGFWGSPGTVGVMQGDNTIQQLYGVKEGEIIKVVVDSNKNNKFQVFRDDKEIEIQYSGRPVQFPCYLVVRFGGGSKTGYIEWAELGGQSAPQELKPTPPPVMNVQNAEFSNDCQDGETKRVTAIGRPDYKLLPYSQVPPGRYTKSQLNSLGWFAGQLSAVKTNGRKVTLFDGPNFNGQSIVLTSNNECLHLNNLGWNDRAQSAIVE